MKFKIGRSYLYIYMYLQGMNLILLDLYFEYFQVEEINKVMGQELGFPEPLLAFRPYYKVCFSF